jgi:TP901 family phage tail tape measure protein
MAINLPIVSKFNDSGVKRGEQSLKKFGEFAAKSAAAATAAVAGIAVLSVKAFGDFDAALNKSISIMGDVSETLRTEMSDAAREVAKNTTFSASEAADAYFFLASAGLDAQASIAAMPQVAKFAQAGMFDMATATDLATDAQSALGLTSDDASENLANLTRVTDVFVKANTLANTSVEQLAAAFTSKAGNALKTVGKSVEEGAAALAVFADQGIKGERAGTLLTNTIFGLTDSLEKNGTQYKELGIDLFDNEGKMLSFSGIAEQFTGVLGEMSTEQKLGTLSQLGFNKQAREGILALVGNEESARNP